jgi:hypothetical protein
MRKRTFKNSMLIFWMQFKGEILYCLLLALYCMNMYIGAVGDFFAAVLFLTLVFMIPKKLKK